MRVTFEGTIHEILDQIEDFCSGLIKTTTPAPKKVAKPKIEQPKPDDSDPVPISEEKPEVVVPDDLLGAVMALVNGDKEKKAKLVKLLEFYEAKTIGGLEPEYREKFWVDVTNVLGGE